MTRFIFRFALLVVITSFFCSQLPAQKFLAPDGLSWFTLPVEDSNDNGPDLSDDSFLQLSLLERIAAFSQAQRSQGAGLGQRSRQESYHFLTRFTNKPSDGKHVLYFDMPDENGVYQRAFRDFHFSFMNVQEIFFFQSAIIDTLAEDGSLRELDLRQRINDGAFGDTSGALTLIDENADNIVDSIRVAYQNRFSPPTNVLLDVVTVDMNQDGKVDAMSLPRTTALMTAFEIRPEHFPGLGQIWVPLHEGRIRIDSDEDGREDTRFARSSAFSDAPEFTRFAQFGDGNQAAPAALQGAQAGLSTEIYLLNTGAPNGGAGLDAEVTLSLNGNDGAPLEGIDLNGETVQNGQLSSMIPAGAMRIFRTDGIGILTEGSLSVESSNVLTGVLNFAGPFGAAGVGESVPRSNFGFPVIADMTGSTGMAVANPAGEAVQFELHLFDADGNLLASAAFELPAHGHLATYVNDIDWVEESGVELDFSDFLGVVKVEVGNGSLYATAIRTRPAQFVTLPVTSSSLVGPADLYLAQFGNGSESGVTLTSDVVLINLGSEEADVTVTFRDDMGAGLDGLEINGEAIAGGELETTVPACGVRILRSSGSGPLTAGAVRVTSDRPLGAVILFDGVGAAGVAAGSPLPNFTLPVIVSSLANTGMAVQNPGNSSLTVNLRLTNLDGGQMATGTLQLPGFGHRSLYVADVDWNPDVDFNGFEGMVKAVVAGNLSVAVTVIQLRDNEFLTMPVGPNPQ